MSESLRDRDGKNHTGEKKLAGLIGKGRVGRKTYKEKLLFEIERHDVVTMRRDV